jgi:Zn-finger nucleic acid-binding protein
VVTRRSLVAPAAGEEVAVVRCPVCESPRVVVVLSPVRKAFCVKCSSRWIQEGSMQRAVRKGKATAEAIVGPTLTEPSA